MRSRGGEKNSKRVVAAEMTPQSQPSACSRPRRPRKVSRAPVHDREGLAKHDEHTKAAEGFGPAYSRIESTGEAKFIAHGILQNGTSACT
jgi:hypothetical protein